MKAIFTGIASAALCVASYTNQVWAADQTYVNNVKGITLNEDGKLIRFGALLIEDGKVKSLDPAINSVANDATVIDGQQHVMMPGLIDAHGHLMGLGANLLEVDLRDAHSAEHAATLVAEFVPAGASQWITGRGWNQELWPSKTFPTKAHLDAVMSDRPIWLTRVDGHAGWANSKALAIAGITADTKSPAGGKIEKDAQGNPTGIIIDNAMALVEQHIPSATRDTLTAQLNAAGSHLLAHGITSMHDAGIPRMIYDFYLINASEGTLPVRVYAMIAATDPDLEKMLANGHIISRDAMLSIRSVKAYGDGALGSRGAALLEPYSDDPDQTGLLLTQPSQMSQLFETVIGADFQLNYHAIGDRANHLALNQFAMTFDKIGGKGLRNRIEHAQVIHPDDLKRFVDLGVLPSMQPTHATSDMNMAESRIGTARMTGAYAWQTLLKLGAVLPLGSDFPVELANPFYGLHAAVTRQDRNNNPVPGWYDHEALTVEQAFRGFTLDAAYGAHMEDQLGTLTPGKWADFILVDQDITQIPPQDIWKTQVRSTWIAGEKVFDATSSQ